MGESLEHMYWQRGMGNAAEEKEGMRMREGPAQRREEKSKNVIWGVVFAGAVALVVLVMVLLHHHLSSHIFAPPAAEDEVDRDDKDDKG